MSHYEFKLPDIGEGVTEGEIVKWLVSPGDTVAENQPMVEVMTDKATVTITSPKTGTIVETRGSVGAVVPVHSVLVVFDLSDKNLTSSGNGGASVNQGSVKPKDQPDGPAATAVGDIRESLPGMGLIGTSKPEVVRNGSHASAGYFNAKPLATPATRKLARDVGIDLRTVVPSGPSGRVTKDDVQRVVPSSGSASRPATRPEVEPASTSKRVEVSRTTPVGSTGEERIPLRGVRKRIFEGMSRSKQTAAHFTFVEECDASALMSLRERLRPTAERESIKLTYLPFIAKAVATAMKKHKTLNASFDEATQEIVVRKQIHLGIATSTEAGLMVVVVRDAHEKSILEIARDIQRMGEDAKAGKIRPEDLGGSTFTITSLGAQGGLFATPVLNFPEVGILGVHRIKERPVVRDGQIAIGNVMLLSLSFDHRLIDGHVGAAFAYEVIQYLEQPDRLFFEMV